MSRFSSFVVALLVASPVFASVRPNLYGVIKPKNTTQSAPAPSQAPAPTFGTLKVTATNNGLAAIAQFELVDTTNTVVFSGASGSDLVVPSGTFTMRATLSGASSIKVTSSVTINKDQLTEVNATFVTAKLSLSISSSSGSTGIAKIYANGVEVGSLGNGNQLVLPAGTYNIKVSHGGVDKWFNNISLTQNQLRNISAVF
jgi:hypothetical protein